MTIVVALDYDYDYEHEHEARKIHGKLSTTMNNCTAVSLRLSVTALLFGAFAMLAQVLLLRALLSAVEENEIVIALFYGAWFFGIFFGAFLVHAPALTSLLRPAPNPNLYHPGTTLPALLVLQAALLPIALISIRTIHATLGLSAAEPIPFGRLAPIVLAHAGPLGFLTGLIFPLLCRLVEKGASQAMARIYAWESLGACAAGAAFTFILAGRIPAIALALVMAVLVSVNAAWLGARLFIRAGFAVCALTFLILAAPPLARRIEAWTVARWWRPYGAGLTLVAERETRLQRVALARQGAQFSLLCNGRFTASFPDPTAEVALANLLAAEHLPLRNVLLIGGLASGLPKHLMAIQSGHIDVTETDPGLITFLTPYLPAADQQALRDTRVRIIAGDGRMHLKRLQENQAALRYDIIACFAQAPSTLALGRTFTREFFAEVRDARVGLLAFPLAAAVGYYGPEISGLVGSVARALGDVFPTVIAAPGATILFMASNSPPSQYAYPTADPEKLARRRSLRNADGFSPLYFKTLFDPSTTRQLEQNLARWKKTAVANTDLNPVATFHALRVWSRTSGSALGWFFNLAPRVTLKRIVITLVVLTLVWVLLARSRRGSGVPPAGGVQSDISNPQSAIEAGEDARASRNSAFRFSRFRALLVIATTGAASIGASILLLLAFQSLAGYLYQALGALAALFMGGLWLGASVARHPAPNPGRRLALCELGWAAFALAAALQMDYLFAHSASLSFPLAASILGALMLAAGTISGAEFVLAGQLHESGMRAATRPIHSTPAAINAADHLGACAGALATGLILIPALGLPGALLALAALKFAGAVICGIPRS